MNTLPIPGDGQEFLSGLLLPLADRQLLVPNVAVAELLSFQAPQRISGAPAWVLGEISWRELKLPLLSFETAAGGTAGVASSIRIAVFNTLGGHSTLRFFALLVQGIPRPVRVPNDLAASPVEHTSLEQSRVQIGGVIASIPDLLGLEQLLAEWQPEHYAAD